MNRRGQTLVEVVIAMLLIAVASIGIFQVLLSVKARSQADESRADAALYEKQLLQELKAYVTGDTPANQVPAGGSWQLPHDTCNCWALHGAASPGIAHAIDPSFLPSTLKNYGAQVSYTVTNVIPGLSVPAPSGGWNDQNCPKQIKVNVTWTPPKL